MKFFKGKKKQNKKTLSFTNSTLKTEKQIGFKLLIITKFAYNHK